MRYAHRGEIIAAQNAGKMTRSGLSLGIDKMANVKTTQDEWGKCREYYEAGLSLSKIVTKTGISKTQISKRSNLEGWSKGTEKEQLIADAVRVQVAKGTLTEQALIVHDEIVDETVNRMEWLNVAALKNVEQAMNLDCLTQQEHRHRAETIIKAKETIFGKTPETAIQINNNQTTPSNPATIKEIAQQLDYEC